MTYCKYCNTDKDNNEFTPYQLKSKYPRCKICMKEYNSSYYKKNKEEILNQKSSYYENNKEEILHDKNHYYLENKEDILNYHKKYYEENKLDILNDRKEYYKENVDHILNREKAYYQTNKDERISYAKKYRLENKEKISKSRKQYVVDNKETLAQKKKDYHNNRLKTDLEYRLRSDVSKAIRNMLFSFGESKHGNSCITYLNTIVNNNYIELLKIHIESQFEPWMTWNNHGIYNSKIWNDDDTSTWTWQLDHIIPQSDLPYDSMEHHNFKKCWALENLRPYSAKQNNIDGASRVRHKKGNAK